MPPNRNKSYNLKSSLFWQVGCAACIQTEINHTFKSRLCFGKSDAHRAAQQKERKEKELEYARFNAEKIEDSSYNASLVRSSRKLYD